mmetsp:Transcript_10267/g.30910  ORF Transcript_10267/g.30910 Transcript_10267/m.30910 type:complete len:546 (+) Transcript_10267:215-1852(+)
MVSHAAPVSAADRRPQRADHQHWPPVSHVMVHMFPKLRGAERGFAPFIASVTTLTLLLLTYFYGSARYWHSWGGNGNNSCQGGISQYGGNSGAPLRGATKHLTEVMLRRGIASRGDELRARVLVQKLLNGEGIHFGIVGGSISEGRGAEPLSNGFGPVISDWINKTFPSSKHTFHNGAIAGSQSSYMSLCVNNHVSPDADLVLVEYDINDAVARVSYENKDQPAFALLKEDWSFRAYERLIRKLLNLPKRPVVIQLAAFAFSWERFWFTREDNHGVVASLYGMPRLSFRSAVFDGVARGTLNTTDFMHDGVHPGNMGHQLIADLVTGYISTVEAGLHNRPLTEEEVALAKEPILPPLILDNYEHPVQNCLEKEAFRDLVMNGTKDGFEYLEEGHGKWGFIGTQPGDWVRFTLDTTVKLHVGQEGGLRAVMLMLSFLASYQHMGKAVVTCVSGCACHPGPFDGYWTLQASQLTRMELIVTESPVCELEIKILEETSSPDGEHKVKFMGIIVSEESWSPSETTVAHVDFSGPINYLTGPQAEGVPRD